MAKKFGNAKNSIDFNIMKLNYSVIYAKISEKFNQIDILAHFIYMSANPCDVFLVVLFFLFLVFEKLVDNQDSIDVHLINRYSNAGRIRIH